MRRQLSFGESIAVRPGSGQRQHQHIIFNAVDEQPVRENVTFPVACPIAGQIVSAVLLRQEDADPLEPAEIKRRRKPYIDQLPEYAYLCDELLNGRK